MPYQPDLLLVNANVLTMDPALPRAGAVAVAGGRVVGVYPGKPDVSARDVIDLHGLTLIPGFHDAHNHMIGFGLALTEVDLRVPSLDELYARVADKAAATPPGEWIVGSGYDQTRTGAHPHRDVLDTIAPNHRVWLKHTSSHMCVVNSLVLRDLGIEIGIDLGLRTGFGDDWLRLGPMKIFTDGSLVGRTAAMSAPYQGDPVQAATENGATENGATENRGYLQADADRLTATIIAAHRAGWRVAAHAIGDRAIDLALDAFAAAADMCPRADPRHRIEHFAAARPDQVRRAAEPGVLAVGQGRFASELGDGMLAAVGPDRRSWLYRQRSLLDAGLVLPGSSDRPVAAGAPLLGLHDMVNRRTATGAPFNAAEAITAAEALRAYTWGSAYASKQEHVKGSIEVGKLADFTALSEDPTVVAADRIAGLEVVATFIDGQPRYTAVSLG